MLNLSNISIQSCPIPLLVATSAFHSLKRIICWFLHIRLCLGVRTQPDLFLVKRAEAGISTVYYYYWVPPSVSNRLPFSCWSYKFSGASSLCLGSLVLWNPNPRSRATGLAAPVSDSRAIACHSVLPVCQLKNVQHSLQRSQEPNLLPGQRGRLAKDV